jgi:hypothetical protein
MSRHESLARVWRRDPNAFLPPALAFGGWFVASIVATAVPTLGNWPYSLPFAALLAWALVAQVRFTPQVPSRRTGRRHAADVEPTVAAWLARSPLGAAGLGVVAMLAYFLIVGTLLGELWLGRDASIRLYTAGLLGVSGGLCVWEIVIGGPARRASAAAGASGRVSARKRIRRADG